ncbi:MAG: hypothetical protein ABI647_12515 [Gemmatimonadota bacterium]
MPRRLPLVTALTAVTILCSGHVGSPDTWFEGTAGPYPIRVVVRLPGVVPGLGQIDVTVPPDGIEKVTAQPVMFDAGKEGAPPPDEAKPIPGKPGMYHAQLWFMTVGSFSVNIEVTGAKGHGTAIVPVAAVAVRQIGLYPWLGKILGVLGLLLFVGAVTIIRAAATDSVVAPGERLDGKRARKGMIATVAGAGLLVFGLWGGRSWWLAVERNYRNEMYRPFQAAASVGADRQLEFAITDSAWTSRRATNLWERFSMSPLLPDHGKLMHLFMVRADDQGAFAHLHPISVDSSRFRAAVGNLPGGKYRVYADVVHETGFPQTMVATVDVPPGELARFGDPDDAVFVGEPGDTVFRYPDGSTLTWEAKPPKLAVDTDAGLTFVFRTPDGAVAPLEPYLGMVGHAVVERNDGSVYVHLHPGGTTSMAAQQALGSRQRTDTVPGMLAARIAADSSAHMGPHTFAGRFSFPYAFPKAGTYRVWVQVRHGGVILTAPFRVDVE